MKLCKRCGETKPLTEFHKDRTMSDGLHYYCKPCKRSANKIYEKRPPRNPAPNGMKRCGRCKETKPLTEFHRHHRQHDGLSRNCKACQHEYTIRRVHDPAKNAANMKQWRDKNPEKAKDHWRKSRYGVPIGWYAEQLSRQGGLCAICGISKPGGKGCFHIDHCHNTNATRGLLCHNCNVGIGHFFHSTDFLASAIQYLTKGSAEG